MKTMFMLRAVAMMFSLGVNSAYAGDGGGDGQGYRPPFTSVEAQSRSVSPGGPQTPKLFTIGRVGVRVWAPVPPPYSAEANEDIAARNYYPGHDA
jgi:hypothetical protein